jgi:RNA polymerase sigma-70 factor, ECF subfamily
VIATARNEAARLTAARARRQQKQEPLRADELFCCPAGDGEVRERAERVAAALQRLEPDLREVVELKTYAGLTFREISEVTGLPQGTVATRYRSALAKMRDWCARQLQ